MLDFGPGFDLVLPLKDEWTKINEQLALLKEEETGFFVAFAQLLRERRNVTGDIKGLFAHRVELNQKVHARTAERQVLISN